MASYYTRRAILSCGVVGTPCGDKPFEKGSTRHHMDMAVRLTLWPIQSHDPMGRREWPRGICSVQKTQVGCGGSLKDDLNQMGNKTPFYHSSTTQTLSCGRCCMTTTGSRAIEYISVPRMWCLSWEGLHTRYVSRCRTNDETTLRHINARA